MTSRESEILKIIKERPMISQSELADTLGITRSSVAVHITNLLKKGCIKGKGYIVDEQRHVLVIGGANVDIQGFPNGVFKLRDSNPGKIKISLGGVGRNIADNLSRLRVSTKLITAIGGDANGERILKEARLTGLDMRDSLVSAGENTSTYISLLDENGDMIAALNHMDVMEKLNVEYLKTRNQSIKNSALIVVDTNLQSEAINYLTSVYSGIPFILDTVSTVKAMKVKDLIGRFHTIKPNRMEAEILSGISIQCFDDVRRAEEYFLNKGVKRIYLSLGEEGLFYSDGKASGRLPRYNVQAVNATGAGDAFVAGIAYGHMEGWTPEKTSRFAGAASVMALTHPDTINPAISVESIMNIMEENHV